MKLTFKYSVFIVIVLLIAQKTTAQIENIEVGKYTTINKLYTGLYARTISPTDTLNFTNAVSFRLGVLVTHRLSSLLSFGTQSAFQIGTDGEFTTIGDFGLGLSLSERWNMRMGYIATPTTTVRPNPITWQSQSETYTQSRIAVQSPGFLSSYSFTDNLVFTYGLHYQNQYWAHHTRIDLNNIVLGGFIQNNGEYFIVIDYDSERWRGMINYSSIEDEFASSLFCNINERYTVYADANYCTQIKETDVARIGFRSYYQSEKLHIKGFLALQYDFASEIVMAEFFVHLD